MKHLRYSYMIATMTLKDNRHAQEVIRDLGIIYQHATPQTLGDQWWFWNCENIPNELPESITELKADPMECIGWGLSKEEAEKIRDYKK